MIIKIEDDFNLDYIVYSGQCFRAKKLENGAYRFITKDNVLNIKPVCDHSIDSIDSMDFIDSFDIDCDLSEWDNIWHRYFDLDRNYRELRRELQGKHAFVDSAMEYGKGLRILKQDPWETLISFIISQRKSIPAISGCVEKIAALRGHIIGDTGDTVDSVYSFPSPEDMEDLTEGELGSCGLGYRVPYIMDAVRRVLDGRLDLGKIASLPDEELLTALKSVHGVGKKVANCVALFAYGRMSSVPIDVWISRAIENDCEGKSPFELYGEDAGIIQQYVFFYEKNGKNTLINSPVSSKSYTAAN